MLLQAQRYYCAGKTIKQENNQPTVNMTSIHFLKFSAVVLFSFVLVYPVQSQAQWSVQDGWALKNGERFFAVGAWGIPKYTFSTRPDANDSLKVIFEEQTNPFNMVYVQYGREKAYMASKTIFTGHAHLRWRFGKGYTGDREIFLKDKDKGFVSYAQMRDILGNLDAYRPYIRKIATEIDGRFTKKGFDTVWLLADEPDNGSYSWMMYPEILEVFREESAAVSENRPLTIVDLFGNIRGNKYLFEQNLKKTTPDGNMPVKLPLATSFSEQNRSFPGFQGSEADLHSFHTAYDGEPSYELKDGKWKRRSLSYFRSKYYQNVLETGKAYKNTSDVLAINAYSDFLAYPEMAGEAVDALREGAGDDKIIWMFYDGQANTRFGGGHNRKDEDYRAYIKQIKVQAYTSIAHGATGVLFWATGGEVTNNAYWKYVREFAGELQQQSGIFKGTLDTKSVINMHLHVALFTDTKGVRWLLAVNTDRKNRQSLRLDGWPAITLQTEDFVLVQEQN